jgi:hypothetical protein
VCHVVSKAFSISKNTAAVDMLLKLITKLCRKQAKIIQNHGNANVCNIGQGQPRHRKFKRLKLGGGQAYHRSSD